MRLSTHGGPSYLRACVFQVPIAKETCQEGTESSAVLSVWGRNTSSMQLSNDRSIKSCPQNGVTCQNLRVGGTLLGLHDLHVTLLST